MSPRDVLVHMERRRPQEEGTPNVGEGSAPNGTDASVMVARSLGVDLLHRACRPALGFSSVAFWSPHATEPCDVALCAVLSADCCVVC